MNCDFCSVTRYNGHKYRQRLIDEIINELKTIKQKYVFFYDDNVVDKTKEQKEHSLTLFKKMAEEKLNKIWFAQCSINVGEENEILKWMYRSGCRIMLVGFESVDENNLKILHKNGIAILGAFFIGAPNNDVNTIYKITKFINMNDIDSLQLTHLTPLPGTKLFNNMERKNRIILNNYSDD